MRLAEDGERAEVHRDPMPMRRLLLVDDHLMLTEALAVRLQEASDLWVAGRCTASDPRLPDIARRLRPDVITIEVEQLGHAFEDVLGALTEACPAAAIVALSSDADVEHAVLAARAGVPAWVPKDSTADELAAVLRGVCQGQAWYPPRFLGPVLRGLLADVRRARDHSGPLDGLSPRERDVLTSMVAGLHGRQIAEHLVISTDTVRTHTKNILAKLGVHSRLEAVRVARAAGLRPPGQDGCPGTGSPA